MSRGSLITIYPGHGFSGSRPVVIQDQVSDPNAAVATETVGTINGQIDVLEAYGMTVPAA